MPKGDFTDKAVTVYLHDRQLVDRFAVAAAEWFAKNPKGRTWSDGSIDPLLLAIRWGLHDRAVFVVRVDEFFRPLIFCDLVPELENPSPSAEERLGVEEQRRENAEDALELIRGASGVVPRDDVYAVAREVCAVLDKLRAREGGA